MKTGDLIKIVFKRNSRPTVVVDGKRRSLYYITGVLKYWGMSEGVYLEDGRIVPMHSVSLFMPAVKK